MKLKPQHYGYLFILPFFLAVLVFQAYPILNTFWTSLTNENYNDFNVIPEFVGFDNYIHEAQSELFQRSLLNTVVITSLCLFLQMSLALVVAGFLTNPDLDLSGQNFWQAILLLPSQISVSILSLYIAFYFYDQGLINTWLKSLGGNGPINFLSMDYSSWFFIIIGWVFLTYGVIAYFLVNSIRSIPVAVFEAAKIDGASGRQIFWRISLPSLQPILVFLFVIALVFNLCLFDLPFAMYPSGGGITISALGIDGGPGQLGITAASYAYQRSFIWDADMGSGASVAMMLFVFISAISLIYFRIMKRTQEEFSVVR